MLITEPPRETPTHQIRWFWKLPPQKSTPEILEKHMFSYLFDAQGCPLCEPACKPRLAARVLVLGASGACIEAWTEGINPRKASGSDRRHPRHPSVQLPSVKGSPLYLGVACSAIGWSADRMMRSWWVLYVWTYVASWYIVAEGKREKESSLMHMMQKHAWAWVRNVQTCTCLFVCVCVCAPVCLWVLVCSCFRTSARACVCVFTWAHSCIYASMSRKSYNYTVQLWHHDHKSAGLMVSWSLLASLKDGLPLQWLWDHTRFSSVTIHLCFTVSQTFKLQAQRWWAISFWRYWTWCQANDNAWWNQRCYLVGKANTLIRPCLEHFRIVGAVIIQWAPLLAADGQRQVDNRTMRSAAIAFEPIRIAQRIALR